MGVVILEAEVLDQGPLAGAQDAEACRQVCVAPFGEQTAYKLPDDVVLEDVAAMEAVVAGAESHGEARASPSACAAAPPAKRASGVACAPCATWVPAVRTPRQIWAPPHAAAAGAAAAARACTVCGALRCCAALGPRVRARI